MGEPVESQDSVDPQQDDLAALRVKASFLQGRLDALLGRIRRLEEAQVQDNERITELRSCLRSLEERLTEAERYGIAARYE